MLLTMAVGMRTGLARMGHGLSGSRSGLAGLVYMMGLRTGLTRMLGAMVSGALSKSHSAGHESGYNEDLFHS